MLFYSIKKTLKILTRDRVLIFWSLLFPIILGFLFKLALGNLDNADQFKQIDISVEESLLKDQYFSVFLDAMEEEDIFIIHESNSEELLVDDQVVAHIKAKDEIITRRTGIRETIVEQIFNSYLENESTVKTILTEKPQANISDLFKAKDFIDDQSNKNMNIVNTYFYTLLGMQAVYGYMWGLEVMYLYEANLSTKAKRNAMAPVRKITSLLGSLIIAWMMSILVLIINFLVAKYINGVEFGEYLGQVIGLLSLGALTGVSLGTFIATSNKKDVEFKIGLGIALSMLCSFMAGMMATSVKVLIQQYAPFLHKINPVALITDGLYSLYYYGSMERYMNNFYWLLGVTAIFLLLTFFFIRGKKYDSL